METATFALNARDRDRSAVSLNDILCEAKTETVAVHLGRNHFSTAIERIEYVRQI